MTAESVSCAACQEVTDQERYAQLEDVLEQYRTVPGALIPVTISRIFPSRAMSAGLSTW